MNVREDAVLAVSGRYDAFEAPKTKRWIDAQLDAGESLLLIDMTDATFVDSTALATLVQGMKHCRQQSGDLLLCGLQQSVRIIFELTRLDQAFRIYPTRADALAAEWTPDYT